MVVMSEKQVVDVMNWWERSSQATTALIRGGRRHAVVAATSLPGFIGPTYYFTKEY